MAEILGIIASAAQLTQFSFKISASLTEICTRLNGAADLQKYLVQIKQLQDTTLLIQYNTELQSSIVKQQLESAITEAEYLESLLSCTLREYTQGNLARRIFNAAKGGKESDIVSSLKRLEQEKTSLVICLTISNSATLSSIQGDLTCLIRKNIQVYTRGTAIPTMNQDSSQWQTPTVKDMDLAINKVSQLLVKTTMKSKNRRTPSKYRITTHGRVNHKINIKINNSNLLSVHNSQFTRQAAQTIMNAMTAR
ncbi:hypothetical protein IFR04_013354 [Cadophora malorum]|uniref:Fungal N-terminal domain-containing protein n=1 Tax=Cadophora malorum TaxID=108018 RepID=A0A8H7T758_9HELO|nr:hypothetical protein IFR04_013354 [Cadophora malorum]